MKKFFDPYLLILITLVALVFTSAAQVTPDTVINMGIYKSYFSKKIKQPVAVTYKMYKGGGEAKRDNDHFTGTNITLHNKDYAKTWFDRGHLASAEDFAYSDSLQGITFSYYNCVPQTPELNRGKWKHYEEEVRKLSQKDTVLVVCYMTYAEKKVGTLSIPDVCYKEVYDMTGKLLLSIAFENTAECRAVPVTFEVEKIIYQYSLGN
jgi:endonuclease G